MSTFEMIVWCVILLLAVSVILGIAFMAWPGSGSQRPEPDLVIEGDRKPGDGF